MQASISGKIRKAFFWENIINFFRPRIFRKKYKTSFGEKFWKLWSKSAGIHFRKYKKSYILRKCKKNFFFRKYKKSFTLRKYKHFLILELEISFSENIRNIFSNRLFYFSVGLGWELGYVAAFYTTIYIWFSIVIILNCLFIKTTCVFA